MANATGAQQELISRLSAACRGERRVPDGEWLTATLSAAGDRGLTQLLRGAYPYAASFDDLPSYQQALLVERVRGEAPRALVAGN